VRVKKSRFVGGAADHVRGCGQAPRLPEEDEGAGSLPAALVTVVTADSSLTHSLTHSSLTPSAAVGHYNITVCGAFTTRVDQH
jgi:hypothetical protein